MPSATYIAIASTTVGSGGTAAITFDSIPNTYTDLVVKFSLRADLATYYALVLKLNNSTSNWTFIEFWANGSSVQTYNYASYGYNHIGNTPTATTDTANTFGNGEIYIPNYAGSKYKTLTIDNVSENNATLAYITFNGQTWSNTAAVTRIDLLSATGGVNMAQYSTATLYGILKS